MAEKGSNDESKELIEPDLIKEVEHLNKSWFQEYSTDDIEFKSKFIELARTGIDDCVKSLQKAILEKDLDEIKSIGHKLKGTSLAVGLTQLSKYAVALELLNEFEEEYIDSLYESLLHETEIVNKL